MTRSMLIALMLATAAGAAHAQTVGGPAIAYIKAGGTAQEIYLVNADRTGLTKLYTAPRKTGLGWLDLKPGGNELAFSEALKIKIQKFHDNGQRNGDAIPIASPCGMAQAPDYHPGGDGTLVFIAACGFGNFQIMTYKAGDAAPQLLFTLGSANRVRWSRTGDHLYYDEALSPTAATARLRRRNVTTGQVDDFGPIDDVASFDVTRTGDRLIHGSALAPKLFDSATMTDTSQSVELCMDGDDLHASPDDSQFIYETPHSARGTYVMIHDKNCSGAPVALTGKGEWHKKDWRPDPVTP